MGKQIASVNIKRWTIAIAVLWLIAVLMFQGSIFAIAIGGIAVFWMVFVGLTSRSTQSD
jgi:hypothetical protein